MSPKRGFVPDDLWRLRAVSDPQVSPEGGRVAFVVATPDRDSDSQEMTVWVAPADGSSPPRQFSSGPRDGSPRWSPDGRFLAFVADRGDGPQLRVAPLDGGEARVLTTPPFRVSQPAWSPDGRRLAFVAHQQPEEQRGPRVVSSLRYRFDAIGWLDEHRTHVFLVDVAGEPGRPPQPRQLTDGDWDDADPSWSPDGRFLAFVSDRSATRGDESHRDVWIVAATGNRRPRRLTRGLGTAALPLWSPDGETIAYVGHEHADGDSASNTHLLVVGTGPKDAGPPRSLSAPLDRTVWGLLRPPGQVHAWSGDGTAVAFLAGDRGTIGLYRADLDDPRPARVLSGDRQVMTFHTAGTTLAFVAQWPSQPPELYCAAADGSGERRVSNANAELRARRWAPVRRITHRAADGLQIESFVLHPPGHPKGQPAPCVLDIHGGPHAFNPQGPWLVVYQALAAAGYVVLLPNPRGSHGYGEAFAAACVGDWGGGDFDDLMGAVDHLVEAGVADPDRLYVAGYSYGGFMTSWVVGHTDRFAAACISAPVTNLASMWGTTDIPNFAQHELGGVTPWESPDVYAKHSPITYVTDITTPVQLLHWEGDLRCPIGQTEELFQALRKLGREVVMVRYPGGFHVERSPAGMTDLIQRHLDWFGSH